MSSSTPTPAAATTDYAVGIDLGTTYSCVGVWRNGTVEILANDQGSRTTPSYVAFTETERLVGESAKNQASSNPTNTIFDAKRLIGRKYLDPSVQTDMKHWPFKVVETPDGKPRIQIDHKGESKLFRPEEISAMVLSKMKETAESALGQPVRQAVVTCPAYFNDSQRQSTKDAGSIAGLNVLRVINEPTAAAIAYGLNDQKDGERNVLIYDLGGGTFDVSLLTIDGGIFEVKATGGDTHLGGEDFDNIIMNHFIQEFKRKKRIDVSQNKRALKRLKNAAERAKRTLSTSTRATVEVDALASGEDFNTTLTRARFEDLCSTQFRDTLVPVEKVLKDAGMSKNMIHEVVLVGGSTRIPKVQSMLSEYFGGKELCKGVNPDEAVAYGAAVQAAILTNHKDNALKELLVVDVCPLSLGIETAGEVMTPIVERNTSIPTSKKKMFSTYAHNQTGVTIKVYEGERAMTRDNNMLGKFDLSGIPPMPRGVPQIEVEFGLDSNGILNVSAKEISTGNQKSIVIKNTDRLSAADIEKMVADSKKYEKEDELKRKVVGERQKLESFLYSARTSVGDMKGTISDEDKKVVENCVEDTLSWLDSHEGAELEELENKYKEVEQVIHPVLTKAYQQKSSGSGSGEMPPESSSPGGMPQNPRGMQQGPTVDELD